MHKLTRSQIEAGGTAMPAIMKYHDNLFAQKLDAVVEIPAQGEYASFSRLVFSHGSILEPRYDDEGNPSDTAWEVADRNGIALAGQTERDLVGKRIFQIGYLHDTDNEDRPVIPYILFENQVMLLCRTAYGGGVIYHECPGNRTWDLFCQFTPNP